jgi:hypothetical protein
LIITLSVVSGTFIQALRFGFEEDFTRLARGTSSGGAFAGEAWFFASLAFTNLTRFEFDRSIWALLNALATIAVGVAYEE